MDKFFTGCLIIIGLVFAFLIFELCKSIFSEKIELNKSEWSCTKTHTYNTTVMIPVGKVMIPQTRQVTECIQYNKS